MLIQIFVLLAVGNFLKKVRKSMLIWVNMVLLLLVIKQLMVLPSIQREILPYQSARVFRIQLPRKRNKKKAFLDRNAFFF